LKAIKLMAVNCKMPQTGVLPGVSLVNSHAHQMRHDVGEPVIVIAFDPNHFDIAFWVRKLTDVAKKFPVIFGEAGEIQVCKNIAEKDQALKAIFLQHAGSFAGVARLCTEMQVGKDQRVVHGQIHSSVIKLEC
jgi:hypothetical protein